MEILKCNLGEEMKMIIKKTIKESFKQNNERFATYVRATLTKLYPKEIWTVIFFESRGYSYSCANTLSKFNCNYKGYRIVIFSNRKNNKESKKEQNDEDNSEEDILTPNNPKSDFKHNSNYYENNIKSYLLTIEELKLKLYENNIKLESTQKIIAQKEKEINKLQNEIQNNLHFNSINNNFYSREQILALNFITTDQSLHFAIPCLKKDLFVAFVTFLRSWCVSGIQHR
jgi:hypothetical protein